MKDLNIDKFILISVDLYEVLCEAWRRGLEGKEVYLGGLVKEVSRRSINSSRVGTNVSLGYAILSVAIVYSLASAISQGLKPSPRSLSSGHTSLRDSLIRENAEDLYEGIRLSSEKHLGRYFGRIPDIHDRPESISVWEVLKTSAVDDSIAYEVINGFPRTLEAYEHLRSYIDSAGANILDGVRETQIYLLSEYPDTLITKSFGYNAALLLRDMASSYRFKGIKNLNTLDNYLRDAGVNPGTTSDILSAALGIYLMISHEGINS